MEGVVALGTVVAAVGDQCTHIMVVVAAEDGVHVREDMMILMMNECKLMKVKTT
jgi:hypothetical protein